MPRRRRFSKQFPLISATSTDNSRPSGCTNHGFPQLPGRLRVLDRKTWTSPRPSALRSGFRERQYVERLIGSIRRECLDHVIVWNETSLRRILRSYLQYYEKSRTRLALAKDAPEPRAVDRPENGRIVAIPQVGGLHHRYERRAA